MKKKMSTRKQISGIMNSRRPFVNLFCTIVLVLMITTTTKTTYAQSNNVWNDVDASRITVPIGDGKIIPTQYRTVSLEVNNLQSFLSTVPSETSIRINQSPHQLALPMPDGSFLDFRILESPIMESGLEAKFPDFKTYIAHSVIPGKASARIGWTTLGFHAMVLTEDGVVFIDPYANGNVTYYTVYYMKNLPVPPDYVGCEMSSTTSLDEYKFGFPQTTATGDELRTYRLAVAATGEYTAQYAGNIATTQAAIVTLMNQVNALYERDIAIRMLLVANNDDLIYTDATTDPFSNVNGNPCDANPRAQNQATIDLIIGTANYDIGHLFTGTNIGGCARIGSVCGANKARGVSGVMLGSAFDIGLTAHEIGHQFNANHTFNSVSGTCNGQLATSAAYEPGSGTTIMSYAGSCAPDMIQGARDMFFHTHSYTEMETFVTVGGGSGCVTIQATTNNGPTVNAGPGGFTIPISTPFTLTGSGSDPDGDPLTYSWEQYDLGPQGSPNVPVDNAPLFRFFPPVNDPVRTFPSWNNILNNNQTMGEILPDYTRSMTFRLVARDNQPGGGGVEFATTSVDVTDAAGPFLVTSPNTAISWCAGSTETVTWDVANTTAAPVSAANVNIMLSIDGGQTFPITLVANTPNDGSQNIIVPNNPVVGNARIMVAAANNIFFDVSNTNFTINAPPSFTSQPSDVSAEWGDDVSFSVAFTGSPTPTVLWQVSTNGGGTFNNIPGESNATLNLTCVTLDMDGYQYRAVLNNVCGPLNSDIATLSVEPRNANATITVTPNPQQYSDLVDFEITITEANVCGEFAATGADIYVGTQFMGSVVFVANGTSLEATLANIALLEPVPYGTAPTGQMSPGMKNVSATLTGTNTNFDVTDPGTILEITPEDARAYYTGACMASTSGANSNSATVTLSATIRDITAEVGDPAWDNNPGDIRNATLTFINRETNTIIAANVPIGLVDPTDPLTAVGTFDWNINIAGNSQTFTIGIIISGYYTRDEADDDVLVTVSKPLPNFVTGGGFIVLQNSAGNVAGDVGSKNNFGFNVKYNKKGTNLQGNVTALVRRTEVDGIHTYKIKSNNLTSLAVQPSQLGGKATINTKASIQDVTNGNNISVMGNVSMQLKISDWGNPGNQDSIAITIWEPSGGLWYASNWTGTITIEQPLAAGNLSIHSNSSFSREVSETLLSEISIYPNPNSGSFSITFDAETSGTYEIELIDVLGKSVVNVLYNAMPGENTAFIEAENIASGIYTVILKNENSIEESKRVFIK